jgi:hypothetical protein
MSLAYWLNTAWMLASAPSAWAFHRATSRVAQTQSDLLLGMLHSARDTEFGRQHRFAEIRNYADFVARVPLATYESYAGAVQRIAAGQANILTADPVTLLEPTSGSTGGEKLIPYTAGLKHQFQRGIAPWIANLLRHRRGIRDGRHYWSISPAMGPRRTSPGGIPIGFEDDTAYLGFFERIAASHVLAAPPSLARSADIAAFRRATLLHLLLADDLTLISVWNPTFLTALFRPNTNANPERKRGDNRTASATGIPSLAPGVSEPLGDTIDGLLADIHAVDPKRADVVASIWRAGGTLSERLRQVWPKLQLVSCWTDAAAGAFLPELRALLPEVEMQPKGLIATEAFVSLPLVDQPGAALAIRSHFFEFEDADGRCVQAHEVEPGGRYGVVVTTAGGLYRYQLRDEVEIVGRLHQCPLLRFLGKADLVSDLVGEKLAEPFVRSALECVWREIGATPKFCMLTPSADSPPRYCLFVEGMPDAPGIGTKVQAALCANPHYRYACDLSQLAPVEVCVIVQDGWSLYEQQCMARGQKLGNIKPSALDTRLDWMSVFRPLLAKVAASKGSGVA